MIEQDTVRLLRECDSGAKMGVDAFTDVLDHVENKEFKRLLSNAKSEHENLSQSVQQHLDRFQDHGKAPSPMVSAMAWLKTKAEMALDGSDRKIADLMTDGCNMGVKSLSKYLNQYAAADETSKNLAKRLIALEDTLAHDMRPYL